MLKKILEIKGSDIHLNRTIKEILINKHKFSNRIIKTIKKNNGIIKNGKIARVNDFIEIGDVLEIFLDEHISQNIIPIKMDLDIIYEDEYLLAVNKPSNLTVHPTSTHYDDTLANGIIYYYNSNKIQTKFRPVNRLDRDTSGIVLVAKNQLSHSLLSKQIVNKEFKKEYIAVVHNKFDKLDGYINASIARKKGSIIEREVNKNGQDALTEYSVITQNNFAALVKINLVTGRTHQIRVHFSYINHILFGDDLYGAVDDFNRQALHCSKIQFIHPFSNKKLILNSCMPDDIRSLMKMLNLDNNS